MNDKAHNPKVLTLVSCSCNSVNMNTGGAKILRNENDVFELFSLHVVYIANGSAAFTGIPKRLKR